MPMLVRIGSLGGQGCEAAAVNGAGVVVGRAQKEDGEWHAFRWQNGQITDLGTLGGHTSSAVGVSEDGTIVGYAEMASGAQHACLWAHGKIVDLAVGLKERSSCATGGNRGGTVIGWADSDATKGRWSDSGRWVVWRKRRPIAAESLIHLPVGWVISNLGGINAAGEIVGECSDGNSSRAFIWTGKRLKTIGNGPRTYFTAVAVSRSGNVIVLNHGEDWADACVWNGRRVDNVPELNGVRAMSPEGFAPSEDLIGSAILDGRARRGLIVRQSAKGVYRSQLLGDCSDVVGGDRRGDLVIVRGPQDSGDSSRSFVSHWLGL